MKPDFHVIPPKAGIHKLFLFYGIMLMFEMKENRISLLLDM